MSSEIKTLAERISRMIGDINIGDLQQGDLNLFYKVGDSCIYELTDKILDTVYQELIENDLRQREIDIVKRIFNKDSEKLQDNNLRKEKNV